MEAASHTKPAHPLVNKVLLGPNPREMQGSRANRVAGVACVGEGRV